MTLLYVVTCIAIGALIAFAVAGDQWAVVWIVALGLLIAVLAVIDKVRPRRG